MDVPDFLQSKQSNSLYNIKQTLFGNRKKTIGVIVLLVLLVAIPLTVWIAQRTQIFTPRAVSGPIELVTGEDSCVVSADTNKVSCASFPIRLTSPLGLVASSSASPSSNPSLVPSSTPLSSLSPSATPSASPIVSCTADSQCGTGNRCWNYQSFPGTCRSVDIACAQVTAIACHTVGGIEECVEFPTSCHVPPGWTVQSPTVEGRDARRKANLISIAQALNQYYQQNNVYPIKGTGRPEDIYSSEDAGNPWITQLTSQYISPLPRNPGGSRYNYWAGNNRHWPLPGCDIDNGKFFAIWVTLEGVNDPESIGRKPQTWCGGDLITQHGWNPNIFVITGRNGQLVVPPAASTTSISSLKMNTSGLASFINKNLVPNLTTKEAFAQTNNTLSDGLVSYWKFDEASGSAALDFKGDHDGIAIHTSSVEGKFNKAKSVGNVDSYITVPDDSDFATANMSVAGWIKPTTFGVNNFESIFGRRDGNKTAGMTLEYAGYPGLGQGHIQCQVVIQTGTIGAVTNTLKLTAGQWNHVACAYDGASVKVYINGVLGATASGTGTIKQTSPMFIQIGKHIDSSAGINAVLDEVMWWNRALTQTEVTALANGELPNIPGGSASPSPLPSGLGTSFYKLAETEAGLVSAPLKPYTNHPMLTEFTFSNSNLGAKQIWAEFIGVDGSSKKEHISVELVEPEPIITSLDCSMDISRQNLKLTLNGARLGSSGGKVTVDSKEVRVTSWSANQVMTTIDPAGNLDTGRTFKVGLTTQDGKVFPEMICQVDTALISLGARLFCREPGKFDVSGVKAVIVDESGNKVNEELTIDMNGIIKGLKTRLQVGKPYTLSIKAPGSLRKNADFIAANGTNIITPRDDEAFILPTGDIAPVVLPDGKINTPDRAEIVRQWSVLGATTSRTGDFNRDGRVNSMDWACMRFDFNKEDETIPARGGPAPSGSSTPTPSGFNPISSGSPSPVASSTPSTSSSPAASPLPSGQRSAYFLLEPLEGGSYSNGDEFIVDVNVWSQLVAANLFVSKISFDSNALEVVRIEKGSILTTWAEEFFNNQTGQISLVAGKPSPGLKTVEGDDPLMARIIFRAKRVGNTTITVTPDSRIYSNDDNSNILTTLLSAQIAITN